MVLNFNSLLATQFVDLPQSVTRAAPSRCQTDESTGLPVRRTRSFGPSFGERTLTVGRGRFSTGATYQHTSYDQFEGESLEDGSMPFLVAPQRLLPPHRADLQATGDGNLLNPGFESDIVTVRLSLKAIDGYGGGFFATFME